MRDDITQQPSATGLLTTRGYQQEMLEESLQKNTIIALDTGSGKTHIAVLRIKHECERETDKVCTTIMMEDLIAHLFLISSRGFLPPPCHSANSNEMSSMQLYLYLWV
jgi:hypothetical protein